MADGIRRIPEVVIIATENDQCCNTLRTLIPILLIRLLHYNTCSEGRMHTHTHTEIGLPDAVEELMYLSGALRYAFDHFYCCCCNDATVTTCMLLWLNCMPAWLGASCRHHSGMQCASIERSAAAHAAALISALLSHPSPN